MKFSVGDPVVLRLDQERGRWKWATVVDCNTPGWLGVRERAARSRYYVPEGVCRTPAEHRATQRSERAMKMKQARLFDL